MDLDQMFGTATPIIGMVHLSPLPGAPQSEDDIDAIVERARDDARALDAGGVDGLIVENFGDAPFLPDSVPKHTVASLTRVADAVQRTVDVPLGINVLRNDATAALSVAAAVDAAFVRVNVHTGARVTDQGIIEGNAHETLRLRDQLDTDVRVFADHAVKHSAPLAGDGSEGASLTETVQRGLADAVIVSGPATGVPATESALEAVIEERDAAGLDVPAFVGSGVDTTNVETLLGIADGVIVGTALKEAGETTAPVDRTRVEALVKAASEVL